MLLAKEDFGIKDGTDNKVLPLIGLHWQVTVIYFIVINFTNIGSIYVYSLKASSF